MLGFHTRSEERDRYADRKRIATLERVLDEIEVELVAEKTGFQRRYESAASTAAFAQQYYEDEVRDARSSAKVDDLTHSLKTFGARIAALDSQISLVTGLRRTVRSFVARHGVE
ncbi:hypothetical protein [Chelativorans xinjiangense]|uniref:hypothetical protein n=1 Tax=Chelativorans xinjiangense TaxID=2681485 RepID=UPI001359B2CC|nr:hypothetical protein [Chelativorans xinjiangense]